MFATSKHHFKVRVLDSLQSRRVRILLYVLHSLFIQQCQTVPWKQGKALHLLICVRTASPPHTPGVQQKFAELNTIGNTKHKSYFYSYTPFFNLFWKTYKLNHCRILS